MREPALLRLLAVCQPDRDPTALDERAILREAEAGAYLREYQAIKGSPFWPILTGMGPWLGRTVALRGKPALVVGVDAFLGARVMPFDGPAEWIHPREAGLAPEEAPE